MLRRAVTLALTASLVSLGAEPAEAVTFDKPIRVINEKNEVRWASDGGTCLTPVGWGKVDQSFKDLQTVKQLHDAEPTPFGWFLGGAVAGSIIASGLLIGGYVLLKK